MNHILTGDAHGVPFAIAEISLLDAKGYRMFGGVLASFRLSRPRPGLTIVTRDRGILGNLLAHAGSGIERLPLEDPTFEGVFEVYGTDQVGGRVILTTTMLERLKALDQLAHARGFACAFLEEHLLIALRGMSWRCPSWRILRPVDTLASGIRGVAGRPGGSAGGDRAHAEPRRSIGRVGRVVRADRPTGRPRRHAARGEVFSSGLWRLVGEGGMALIYVASGSLFGGVALFGAWYGVKEGYSSNLFWYFWGLISAGIVYGAYAIATRSARGRAAGVAVERAAADPQAMKHARAYFDQLNRAYNAVHQTKEDLFWATYMAISDDQAGFTRAENAYKDFISDPAKLQATRDHRRAAAGPARQRGTRRAAARLERLAGAVRGQHHRQRRGPRADARDHRSRGGAVCQEARAAAPPHQRARRVRGRHAQHAGHQSGHQSGGRAPPQLLRRASARSSAGCWTTASSIW